MSRRGSKQSYPDLLQFPGGGVEKKETPLAAAFRETYEETGVKLKAKRTAKFIGTVGIWAPDDKPFLVHGFLYYLPCFDDTPNFRDPEERGITWGWVYPEEVGRGALRCVGPLLELADSYLRKNK